MLVRHKSLGFDLDHIKFLVKIDLERMSMDIHCFRHGFDGLFNFEQKGTMPFLVFLHPLGHL